MGVLHVRAPSLCRLTNAVELVASRSGRPREGMVGRPGAGSGATDASSGQAERWVAVGEKTDVGLHAEGVPVGAHREAPDALGVLTGEQHGEKASEDAEEPEDVECGQHEVLGDGQGHLYSCAQRLRRSG